MAYFAEKLYDANSDRLFLAYYALPGDLVNANGWGVTSASQSHNMPSFREMPVVLKRKDFNNPKDVKQAGLFVHPYAPQHGASLQDQLEHQNVYTVGKILDVKLNPQKGWKFEVEVTDPLVKEALKNNDDKQAPQWVSPLIRETAPNQNPRHLEHWAGLHVAFVDVPAFGFELMKPAGICSGTIEECTIKLHNASELNQCGFCPKDAMLELLSASASAYSSQSLQNESSNTLMSSNDSSPTTTTHGLQPARNLVSTTTTSTTTTPPTTTDTTTIPHPYTIKASEQSTKIEGDNADTSKNVKQPTEAKPEEATKAKDADTPLNAELPKNYEEAMAALRQRDAELASQKVIMDDVLKNQKKLNEFVNDLKRKETIARIKARCPKHQDLFKSDSKYEEQIEKYYNLSTQGVSDDDIAELYQSKLMQVAAVPTIRAASTKYENMKDVPDFHGASSADKTSSDNRITKQYELMRLLTGGGRR